VSGTAATGLVFDKLLPGELRTATIGLWNDSSESVSLSMRVSDVADGENGCVEPESNEGADSSCDVGEGELSEWLELAVTRTDGADDELLWTGPFTAMTTSTVLTDAMAAGDQWQLRIDVGMRPEAGNATMTDAVVFTMGWSAHGRQEQPPGEGPEEPGQGPVPPGPGEEVDDPDEAAGADDEILGDDESDDDVQVAGVAGSRPDAEVLGAQGIALPFTGATVEPWLLVYAVVLIGGGALLLARAQRQAAPVRARQDAPA
jgi:hypothetical protein